MRAQFDIIHYFSSDVGLTNIVGSTGQSGAETKYKVPTVQGQFLFSHSLLLSLN